MKLKHSLLSIVFTILCCSGTYSQRQQPTLPKVSLKEALQGIIETVNDPEYISVLSLDDRLILGVLRMFMVEPMFNSQVMGMQVPEHYLLQAKNKMIDDLIFKLNQLPNNPYWIEKLGLIPIIASGGFFLLACGTLLGFLGADTRAAPFFILSGITFVVSILEIIAKFYRLYQRLLVVQKQLMQQLSNQAAKGGGMF